ncbi:hypothetical protein [Phthorimaea operculella granulovirus]|uniref:Uncharacterized protein n=1 Tax=Phthorimaea operculella granulovirus TaxID=192584 RepID=Q8JS36_9BBAC|nr:hypothetical protein [Phthorimaea operculella granulovirus]AAM70221.1 unknown [Phthorimaea operculella granulovirus]ANY57412.1 hypothetical protein PhopGVgp023 [Phthorimaea operculella granulovirus]QBH65858.1 hypothetical protein PhopGVgp023 [Phthorimaea operculella granulovirus]QBH65988.1 hypothetical protein PhopGVgp023 [Phthorimaea operculella granulovirus]QBH66118.1 hypothetical protein PhopGVgp023 [Phthorimaea operculella granulovirus]
MKYIIFGVVILMFVLFLVFFILPQDGQIKNNQTSVLKNEQIKNDQPSVLKDDQNNQTSVLKNEQTNRRIRENTRVSLFSEPDVDPIPMAGSPIRKRKNSSVSLM